MNLYLIAAISITFTALIFWLIAIMDRQTPVNNTEELVSRMNFDTRKPLRHKNPQPNRRRYQVLVIGTMKRVTYRETDNREEMMAKMDQIVTEAQNIIKEN